MGRPKKEIESSQGTIAIDSIEIDDAYQMRVTPEIEERIEQYMLDYESKAILPPVQVIEIPVDGGAPRRVLVDGRQRLEARKRLGYSHVQATITQGDHKAAIFASVSGNRKHGEPFTSADKRRCIRSLLEIEECRKWADSRIATTVGVDRKTVRTVREELAAHGQPEVDPEVKVGSTGRIERNRRPPSERPQPRATPQEEVTEEAIEEAASLTTPSGEAVPASLTHVFGNEVAVRLTDAARTFHSLRRDLNSLNKEVALGLAPVIKAIKTAEKLFIDARPHTVCPACHGTGKTKPEGRGQDDTCATCNGSGWLSTYQAKIIEDNAS